MYEDLNRFRLGHLAIAFISGALAAVAVTLLTTPVTGRESRNYLLRLARRSKDVLAETPDALRRGFRRGKRQVQRPVDEVSSRIG